MKLRIILSVLLLFSLLKVDANSLANKSIASGRVEKKMEAVPLYH